MTGYHDIAICMAQELRDLVADAIEASGDPAALMSAQLLIDEFDELERSHRLLTGDGQGGPFAAAVTRTVHRLTYHTDWWEAYDPPCSFHRKQQTRNYSRAVVAGEVA